MTVEEIEIIVTAKVEEALKEFLKIAPTIKKAVQQVQDNFQKIDTSKMKNKIQQAVQFTKKKMQDLKKGSKNNELAIKVNNKEAEKQITQIQKQIDSLQEKINSRQLKLDLTNSSIDRINAETRQQTIKDLPNLSNKTIKQETYNRLNNNTNYMQLLKESDKLNNEIEKYNLLLDTANSKMLQLQQKNTKAEMNVDISEAKRAIESFRGTIENQKYQIELNWRENPLIALDFSPLVKQLKSAKQHMLEFLQNINKTGTSQNKLTNFFYVLKDKIEQSKISANKLKNTFNQMPKMTQKITNNAKNIGTNMKSGLRNVLKYAGALFSLRGIYSMLSSSAQSWLSSQNAQAKQLSANIEYMRYAMGSALAPVIQFVTNLVYQLMKAIQSVAYALTGVNIFAKATANSMKSASKSAKDTNKSLASVHSDISNISDKNNNANGDGSVNPSIDLSKIDNTPNSIVEAIKNGNWYEIGATIGEKLNKAMDSIPWEKIQNKAKKIATNIAQGLNGFIATTDWNNVGNTLAQGLNTAIYFGYDFVTTFDWKNAGNALGNSINGLFKNIEWGKAGQTVSEGMKGCLNFINQTISTTNWNDIGKSIATFLCNIEWYEILDGLQDVIANALIGMLKLAWGIVSECIGKIDWSLEGIWNSVEQTADIQMGVVDNIVEQGFKELAKNMGISEDEIQYAWEHKWESIGAFLSKTWEDMMNGLKEAGKWIKEKVTEICESVGKFFSDAWQGICDTFSGIGQWFSDRWNDICNVFSGVGQWFSDRFNEAVQGIQNIFSGIGNFFSGVWQGICDVFGNVANWFGNIFGNAWQAVKNVFSAGGQIFDGIKDGILNGLKSIVNAIIKGINKVVAIPFNGINSALRAIRSVDIMGIRPFSWINTIGVPQIPTLAKGGVLYDDTIVRAGEYLGASSNPEIVTPQNIMYDTMKKALADSDFGSDNEDRPIYLTINVGNKKIGQIALEDIRDIKRQTGKDIEVLVGG